MSNNRFKILTTIFVVFIFLAILIINYFDVLKFKYYVPPGNDPTLHTLITREILEKGKTTFSGYPPGFHYIIAGLSKLSDTDPVKTMVYFYPFLMFLSALAVYLLGKQFFGKTVAILSLILYGFISPQPRQTLWDGGFPNLMGADFLMILGFFYFLKAYKNGRIKDIFFAGLFLGLAPFFHHLSSYLMITLIVPISLSLLVLSLLKKQSLKKKLIILGLIFGIALFIGAYPGYIYFGKEYLKQISNGFVAHAASWQKFISQVNKLTPYAPPIPFSDYFLLLSPYLWIFGWLSVPFLLKGFLREKREEYVFVFVWLLIVFIFSRPISLSPMPGRIARELSIPLALSSGIFLKEIFVYFKELRFTAVLAILIGLSILRGLFGLSDWVGKYNPMVFIQDVDMQAINWIKNNTEKEAKFLVAPYNPWLYILTQRSFTEIRLDFDKMKNGDYLYINRYQEGYMWGDRWPYLRVREEVQSRKKDFQLIKNFGSEDERGITIYKIKK